MPEPENKAPENSAPAEVPKEVQKDGVVRDAAHAAADVEADAVAAAAAAEREANKIAEVAGAKAAEKWLESKMQEIEAKATAAIAEVKKSFEDRLAAIEGKLKPAEGKGTESGPNSQPDSVANEKSAPVAQDEPPKRKVRRV